MNEQIRELVKAACAGDSDAFSQLAEMQRRVAASVAYGILADPHLAADAVQDSLLKAYQRLNQLKDHDAFVAWFLGIVRATSIDIVRRRKRRGGREVPIGSGEQEEKMTGRPPTPPPSETLVQQENASDIREALASLSAEYREVILLKHLEGRSYREIAQLLDTSVRAVESRLFRARQQLHKMLRARDVPVTGAARTRLRDEAQESQVVHESPEEGGQLEGDQAAGDLAEQKEAIVKKVREAARRRASRETGSSEESPAASRLNGTTPPSVAREEGAAPRVRSTRSTKSGPKKAKKGGGR